MALEFRLAARLAPGGRPSIQRREVWLLHRNVAMLFGDGAVHASNVVLSCNKRDPSDVDGMGPAIPGKPSFHTCEAAWFTPNELGKLTPS